MYRDNADTEEIIEPRQAESAFHYENTPIQIYRRFQLQKLKIFR